MKGSPLSKLYWEDFQPGRVFERGPRRISREEIVAFAAEFDPQPMHLDEEAARGTMLGGLAASGWHSCGILMRMCTDAFVLNSASRGAPGVDEVKWRLPVRPGDELRLRATVLEARLSRSRADMGFARFLFELINQTGAPAVQLTTTLMMGRRNSEAETA